MYHNIGAEHEFNTLSVPLFKNHIKYLKSSGYTMISLSEYVENIRTGINNNKAITLTFDDAYISIPETVLPALKKEQIPFSVFVPVNFVGQHNKWDVEEGLNISKIMSWEQLTEIATEELVTIGSHGMSHTSFGKLNEQASVKELKDSKAILEEKLQTTVSHFSYPYGQYRDLGNETDKKLQELGYKSALSTLWGRRNTSEDIFRLKRIEVETTDDVSALQMKVENRNSYREIKQAVKNAMVKLGLWG